MYDIDGINDMSSNDLLREFNSIEALLKKIEASDEKPSEDLLDYFDALDDVVAMTDPEMDPAAYAGYFKPRF